MKYLLKLNKHINLVQEIIDGKFKMVDVDGNELFFSNKPNYILEFNENDTYLDTSNYAWYLYPEGFEKYKIEYWAWWGKHLTDKEEILSEFERESNTEILSINEI